MKTRREARFAPIRLKFCAARLSNLKKSRAVVEQEERRRISNRLIAAFRDDDLLQAGMERYSREVFLPQRVYRALNAALLRTGAAQNSCAEVPKIFAVNAERRRGGLLKA